MEMLDILDENGNYTGQAMERAEVHNLNLFHWEVCIFIINENKEVLLQKRSPNKRFDPNKWGLCAGHVESGETPEVSALRELEEEIGLKASPDELHLLDEMKVKKREVNSHVLRSYYVIYNGNDFKIQKEELSEVRWFNIDDIIKLIKAKDESIVFNSDSWINLFEKLKTI